MSGAFGCTKASKGGVAATIGEDGPFEGLCSGRFIVAFLGNFFVLIEFDVNFILANMFTLAFKGTAIGLTFGVDQQIGGNMMATITFLLLTLPNLLTAMFTTMGRNNWRKLLTHHPHLLLLPTYTFFSFEKFDDKIRFTKRMTVLNIIICSVCCGVLFVPLQEWEMIDGDRDSREMRRFAFLYLFRILFLPPLFIPAIILSMMFLFMEKCCGCCCLGVACCNITDQIRVYDPDTEKVKVDLEDGVEMEQVQVEVEVQNENIPSITILRIFSC